ncbi:DeoR/GlpR family DNA-binding transcription regulator [Clostridium massiliamazoniense]|uniref:DeoR/GlpR family DNA-binding transcription regulator n=1 Tax=Clostridium massiliamazoniense TaxID=1347366 RepID=UPI0006D78FE5|nr:DeoR/GlpR family DNA-binding transcription regulator [Clostridium massiliamazoniense]
MLTEKRHEIILSLLNKKSFVSLKEILESTNSSESTIRRDLKSLEIENKLKRVHGGAKSLSRNSIEASYNEKSSLNINEKKSIALFASNLIEDGDCIYLDGGTTTYSLIEFLSTKKDILVVTNGIHHINALLDNNIKCFMVGGNLKQSTRVVLGSEAIKFLNKFRFDKAFLGTNGVHPELGFTTPDIEEASIKETAIKLSKESFILCDSTKIDTISFVKFADINQCTLVSTSNEKINKFKNLTDVKVVD